MHTRTIAAALAGIALAAPSFAFAASAHVEALMPGASVQVGTTVTFSVATGDLSSPTYTLRDSFSGSTASASNMSSDGSFSWTPSVSDVGNHNFTITVSGSSGASATAQESVFVNSAAAVVLVPVPPQTAKPGDTLSFRAVATGFGAPSYAIADSFANSGIASTSISNAGYVTWVPGLADAGLHLITVTVTDPQGHSASITATTTVTAAPTVVIPALAPAMVGQAYSFTLTPYGFTNPSYAVRDSVAGSSVAAGAINASSTFSWTPLVSDVGIHQLTITASDAYAHVAYATVPLEVRAATSTASAAQAAPAGPSGLSQVQVDAILSLLQSFGADSATIANVRAALGGSGSGSAQSSGSAGGYTFVSFLTVGSSGAEVTALQQKLSQLGFFSGDATGYFGAVTQAAVKAFQAAHGLDTFGYVGPGTRAALNR